MGKRKRRREGSVKEYEGRVGGVEMISGGKRNEIRRVVRCARME